MRLVLVERWRLKVDYCFMKPITYPARPVNGGSLERALPKSGTWFYEPKYNEWRAMTHVPSGNLYNRHGVLLSIADEFTEALRLLRSTMDGQVFKWVDLGVLERRHKIGQGCLIVLDVIPEPAFAKAPYTERRKWIEAVWPELDLKPPRTFPLASIPTQIYGTLTTWFDLQAVNTRLGCEFYEGLVAKRGDSIYPIQLRSPEVKFHHWVKHRWAF